MYSLPVQWLPEFLLVIVGLLTLTHSMGSQARSSHHGLPFPLSQADCSSGLQPASPNHDPLSVHNMGHNLNIANIMS